MTQFRLKVRVKGRKTLAGVIAEVFNEDGDLLDSLDFDSFRQKFTFGFDQDQALKGKNRADLVITLTDVNGDDVNLRRRNGSELDLDVDEQSFSVSILARKQHRRFILPAVGNLQANSSDSPVSLSGTMSSVSDDVLLNNIMLSAGQDIYSDTIGGSLIDGAFVENLKRLTASVDVVNASPGSLGEHDDLFDATAKDGDQLNLSSNTDDSLENAIGNVSQVVGFEILNISAADDTSVNVDFIAFQGLESVSVFGTFSEQVLYRNYLRAGARVFDFSGIYTGGVNLSDNSFATNDSITLIGSSADDILHANDGVAEIRGGGGNDTIQGSMIVGGVIAGGPGADTIRLQAASSVDVVSLEGITSNASADTITNFVGFNTDANAADLLRFDASTFYTYTAGNVVTEIDAANAHASQLSNLFIVDTEANIANVNTLTNEPTLALTNDTGLILFASHGVFADAVHIGTIDDFANFVATANVEIV